MATSSLSCGVCNHRYITKPSIVWCTECDEGLCTECKDNHSLSKESRSHSVTPIAEYQNLPVEVLKMTHYCTKHEEKYQRYCQKHECPCCGKCINESHKECRNISKLDDVSHGAKTSTALCEIEETLVEVAKNLKIIRQHQQNNLLTFQESRKEIEKEVKQTRTKINIHLDNLQEDLMKQLKVVGEKENSKITKLLLSLEKEEKEISDWQRNILKIKQHATDLQMFLSMKKIEEEVNRKDKFMQSLVESERQYSTSFKANISIQNIMFDIKSFGEVYTEYKPCDIVLIKKKVKQAQMIIHVPTVQTRSIEKIKLKIHKSITTDEEDISGCCMLPDGKLAFSYLNKKTVQVLNSKGIKDLEVKTPSAVFDIVYISQDNTLAGTSGASQKKCIYIIDLERKQIMKTISLDSYNYGIALKDNRLIYSGLEKGIQMIHLNDESIRDICPCQIPARCYMATFEDNIYHTNNKTSTVTCYNLQGEIQWTFQNEGVLKDPRGIDVDSDGNVYVVGFISQNLIVISTNGQHHRELLTEDDVLRQPITFHYNGPKNELLVANNKNNTAIVFNVT